MVPFPLNFLSLPPYRIFCSVSCSGPFWVKQKGAFPCILLLYTS